MNITHGLVSSLFVVVCCALLIPFVSGAAEFRSGEQPSIGANERIGEDTYIAGGNISSAGTVVGDLLAAGGNVLVSGGVGNDLMAAGGSLTVLGNVADDVRVAGGNVLIQGSVGGDLVIAGGQLNISGSGVKGDLFAGGGTIRVDAPVGGKVRIGGGEVLINSTIQGDVEVTAESLTLGSNARIRGNLTYTAEKEARMEAGAVVSGKTTFNELKRHLSEKGIAAVLSFALLGSFLTHLVSALFFGLFFRRFATTVVSNVVEKPLFEIGRGLVVLIVLPVVSVMLFFTLLGIPLGLLGLLAFGLAMLVLWMVTPVVLGSVCYRFISKREHEVNWKTILLGVFLYTILGVIPFIGWFVQCAFTLATLGASAKLKWEMLSKEWR